MSTGNQNLDLLVKLLMMTTSPNDGEALLAMRKANAQLAKFHTSWERFVKDRITVAADPFAHSQSAPSVAKSAPPSTNVPPKPQQAPASTYTPPPRRAPQPPPIYAHTAPPQPQATAAHQAHDPYDYPAGAPRSNVHPGVCYDCQRKLAKDDGILWRKNRQTGRWHLKCAPGFGCQASSYAARGRRPAPTASDIDALF